MKCNTSRRSSCGKEKDRRNKQMSAAFFDIFLGVGLKGNQREPTIFGGSLFGDFAGFEGNQKENNFCSGPLTKDNQMTKH